MNRRGFLRALAAGAPVLVAPALIGELLAPKRTIFLPPRGGWYADEVYDLQTAIGAELDKLLSLHSPIYYNETGIALIQDSVHTVLRKIGETDDALRKRMMLTVRGTKLVALEGWPAATWKVFEVG